MSENQMFAESILNNSTIILFFFINLPFPETSNLSIESFNPFSSPVSGDWRPLNYGNNLNSSNILPILFSGWLNGVNGLQNRKLAPGNLTSFRFRSVLTKNDFSALKSIWFNIATTFNRRTFTDRYNDKIKRCIFCWQIWRPSYFKPSKAIKLAADWT